MTRRTPCHMQVFARAGIANSLVCFISTQERMIAAAAQRPPTPPSLPRRGVTRNLFPACKRLVGVSHLLMRYWFDQAPPAELAFTRRSTASGGVCARRAPHGSGTPIGFAVAFEGFATENRLRVYFLDCCDHTP